MQKHKSMTQLYIFILLFMTPLALLAESPNPTTPFPDVAATTNPTIQSPEIDNQQATGTKENFSSSTNNIGQGLADVNKDGVSKSSLKSRAKTTGLGQEAARNSAILEDAYQNGEINEATKDDVLTGLALQEMMAFQNGMNSGGKKNADSGSSDSAGGSSPTAPAIPDFSSPSFSDNGSGSSQQLAQPIAAMPVLNNSPVEASQDLETIQSNPTYIPIAYSVPVEKPVTDNGSDKLQNVAQAPLTTTGSKDSKLKMDETQSGSANNGASALVIANGDSQKLSPRVAQILLNALKKNSSQATAQKSLNKNTEADRGLASTTPEQDALAMSQQMAQFEQHPFLKQLEDLGNIYVESSINNTRDLGKWIRTSFAHGKQDSKPTHTITLTYVDFSIGVFAILTLFGALLLFALHQYRKAKNTALVVLSVDSATHTIDIEMFDLGNKIEAVLTQYAKGSKKILRQGSLHAGSIVLASYLPPEVLVENGFKKKDHVELTKNGTWRKVTHDLHIAIRPYKLNDLNSLDNEPKQIENRDQQPA